MFKELFYFFRYGPEVQKRQKELGPVEFLKVMSTDLDADGFSELRTKLVSDIQGEILEIGTGTGATFPYYGPQAKVIAIEPHEDFRAAAEEAAGKAKAEICVVPGAGEELPFEDGTFDAVTASTVLCSVISPMKTLGEMKRVLRPGGQIRLLEHVCSEHWLAGPVMKLLNPIWLRINKMGCHWDRKTVELVQNAGFLIRSVESHKIFSKAVPASLPLRLIKAERPA